MWAVSNQTAFKADATWGRNLDGVHEWIVAVKATFSIQADGTFVAAEEQVPPLLAPEYNGEPGASSLRYEADLLGVKPTTDVIVNGTAYAPGGKAASDFLVSLTVGPMTKTLRVRGDREWDSGTGSRPSPARAVTEVPILYERAYGGYDHRSEHPEEHRLDPRNPVGCGVSARTRDRAGTLAPNFEYPKGDLERAGPAGFGAIDSFWSPRRELAGTYDERWMRDRLPLLPLDWNPLSLQCAPADQRPETHLHGGEQVELVNLTREGVLRFTLPKLYFVFSTFILGRPEEHRGHLVTVVIEPDERRVLMTWVSSLLCQRDVDYLDVTVVREKPFI